MACPITIFAQIKFPFFPDRPVKSTLLDILLLRASGWKVEEDSDEQDTGSQFTEGEVFIEDDVTEEQQPEGTGDQDDDEGVICSIELC